MRRKQIRYNYPIKNQMFPCDLENNQVTLHILDVPLVMYSSCRLYTFHDQFHYQISTQSLHGKKKTIQAFEPMPFINVFENSEYELSEEKCYLPKIKKNLKVT